MVVKGVSLKKGFFSLGIESISGQLPRERLHFLWAKVTSVVSVGLIFVFISFHVTKATRSTKHGCFSWENVFGPLCYN